MLQMDLVIEGLDMVKKIPIEIKGQWSFPVSPNSERFWLKAEAGEKKKGKEKPAIVVNI